MEYAKEFVIASFDLMIDGVPGHWSIGALDPEAYFELRIMRSHQHCPCSQIDASEILDHYIGCGLSLSEYHVPDGQGVLLISKR